MGTQIFKIKRNDTLPALRVSVKTNGDLGQKTGYNLSGATGVTFTMVQQNCDFPKVFQQDGQFICQSGGTIQYNWQEGDTDTSGNYEGEFELIFSDGNKLSIPTIGNIKIEIFNDLNSYS